MNTRHITRLSMLLALGLILSYLESMIPLNLAIPGIKIGLANMVTMFVLYKYNVKDATIVLFLRVLISGFLFSGMSSIIFGIAGGFLCILIMSILKKTSFFSVMGVSMAGAVSHNIGQLIAAFIIMDTVSIAYYLPYLLLSGLLTGALIGYLSAYIISRFKDI